MAEKKPFLFNLDDDLKSEALKKAEEENRSLGNLIETALIRYINGYSVGARVTVRTPPQDGKKRGGEHTGRIISFDKKTETIVLDKADPVSGLNTFNRVDIQSIHLI